MATNSDRGNEPIIIKKYANRRLYNTRSSSYITLEDLSRMTREGTDFQVLDAKTGNDITHQILTQIIMEEESHGEQMLPISFLRQLISLYGDSMQWMVPRYLEQAMAAFALNQEQMRKSLQQTFGGIFPFGKLEEMGKQNLALFEQTMKMFSPFTAPGATAAKPGEKPEAEGDIKELNDRINTLQKQVEELTKHRKE